MRKLILLTVLLLTLTTPALADTNNALVYIDQGTYKQKEIIDMNTIPVEPVIILKPGYVTVISLLNDEILTIISGNEAIHCTLNGSSIILNSAATKTIETNILINTKNKGPVSIKLKINPKPATVDETYFTSEIIELRI